MSALTGFPVLLRLALRRDRVMLPAWLSVFVLTAAVSAGATAALYPDAASRVAASATANNASALIALYGRVYDPASLGELATLKMAGFGAAMVALLTMLTVLRHTRAEEEAGRLELLGAVAVGRFAALTAALVTGGGTALVIGVTTAAALAAFGLPLGGSIAFGVAWFAVGTVFAAVGAVCAQLTTTARTAKMFAGAVLAAGYVARAIGDVAGDPGAEPAWPTWVSPIGWAQQLRPYSGERWWVLALSAAGALALVLTAFALAAHRDLGQGTIPDPANRRGAVHARFGAAGLAWRLQRGTITGWLIASVILGAVLGTLATDVVGMVNTATARELFEKLGGAQGIVDSFLATELAMMGIIVSIYVVQAVLVVRHEETGLHAEPLLATGLSRGRWLAGHLSVAIGGAALILVAGGVAAGLAHGARVDDVGGQLPRLLFGALLQLPAVAVVAAITAAAIGLAPRLAWLGWAALVGFLLIGELGPLLRLGQGVLDVSPFTHVPKLPSAGSSWPVAPLLWLTAVAAAIAAAGFAGLRRRDIG